MKNIISRESQATVLTSTINHHNPTRGSIIAKNATICPSDPSKSTSEEQWVRFMTTRSVMIMITINHVFYKTWE